MCTQIEERLITRKEVVKRKDNSGKLVNQEITMLLINRGTCLYVEIHEEPTLDLLHKLQAKYNVSW